MKSGAGARGTELSCTHGGASESLESFLNNLNLFYAGKSPTLASKHGLNVGRPHREANGALALAVVAWRKRGGVASVTQGTACTVLVFRAEVQEAWMEGDVTYPGRVQRHHGHRHGFGSAGHNR